MRCPNCNAVIPEGKMYCDNCGAELQIVPDIDVEIQATMEETLSNIVENEFYDDYEEEDDIDLDDDPNLLSMIVTGRAGGKVFYIIFFIILAVIIGSAIFLGRRAVQRNGLDYQLEMAQESKADNKYLDAATYYEKAYSIEQNADYLFNAADCYHTIGRENDAIATLNEIATGTFPQATIEEAYGKIIYLYESSGSYNLIADMLESCTNERVLAKYSNYAVAVPQFSHKGATYEETVVLKLSSELPGKIYYTIDGTEPNAGSPVYDNPIFLEYGSYTVKALYINEFGAESEVVTEKYLIDVDVVFEPTILTDTGEYDHATFIEADLPVMYTMYYTTDGTEPTKESTKWTGPIPMPLGSSTYKFIAYASDGTQSEVVERIYNLSLNCTYSPSEAVSWLQTVLNEKGINSDPEGHREGINGQYLYVFTTAYPIEDRGDFFFIVEYLNDEFGNTTRTGIVYAMNVSDAGIIYRVQPKGTMSYSLMEF